VVVGGRIFGLNWENGVVSGNVHRRLKFWIGSVVAVEMLLKGVFGMNSRRSCVICGGSSCICGDLARMCINLKLLSQTRLIEIASDSSQNVEYNWLVFQIFRWVMNKNASNGRNCPHLFTELHRFNPVLVGLSIYILKLHLPKL